MSDDLEELRRALNAVREYVASRTFSFTYPHEIRSSTPPSTCACGEPIHAGSVWTKTEEQA